MLLLFLQETSNSSFDFSIFSMICSFLNCQQILVDILTGAQGARRESGFRYGNVGKQIERRPLGFFFYRRQRVGINNHQIQSAT